MMMIRRLLRGGILLSSVSLLATSCSEEAPSNDASEQAAEASIEREQAPKEGLKPLESYFFTQLERLCAERYGGELVSDDPQDEAVGEAELVMHVDDCQPDEIGVNFRIGDDASRNWVISKAGDGLHLVHHHRGEDGEPVGITHYGGQSRITGPHRLEFPADDATRSLFEKEGLHESRANIWALELEPGRLFAYELRRPERFFRVEFDLTKPLSSAR